MLVEDIYKAIALLKSSITLLLEMMMLDDGYTIAIISWLSAEGRVENQKLNQVEFLVFNSIYYKKTWSLFPDLPLMCAGLIHEWAVSKCHAESLS